MLPGMISTKAQLSRMQRVINKQHQYVNLHALGNNNQTSVPCVCFFKGKCFPALCSHP